MKNERIQEIKQAYQQYKQMSIIDQPYDWICYLLSEVERLQEENKAMKEALEWTRKRFDDEWTYEMGIGEVVDEILGRFEGALSHLKGE